jgi:hypothetical protein
MKLITLKANQIKQEIALKLNDLFFNEGFVYKKTTNEFRLSKGDYTYIFFIEQVAWTNSFSINVHLYISQKQIESILEKIIGKQRHKLTFIQDIGRIYKSPDGRKIFNGDLSIWLSQDEDVESAIESLGWYFKDVAKPYFAKYDNLNAIDNIVNNPPFNHSPAHVGSNFDFRCMKGLIAARLVNNPKYEELVSIYDEGIKGTMDSESIENYYKVRDYLKYNRITK